MKVEMHTHTSETSPCAHINAKDVLNYIKKPGMTLLLSLTITVNGLLNKVVQRHPMK